MKGRFAAAWLLVFLSVGAGSQPARAQLYNYLPNCNFTFGPTTVDIVTGPDGALWFTQSNNMIGRMTTAGVATQFPIPTASSVPSGIAVGPDGNLWFTEYNGDKIGRITTGGTVTEFPLPPEGESPLGITAGPDGNLWFVAEAATSGGSVGRITTAGAVTMFPTGSTNNINDITAGPDGNLWVAAFADISKVTTAGVITPFQNGGEVALSITSGSDGNLWYVGGFSQVNRITTAGVVTHFPLPSGFFPSGGITSGTDGNLWFTVQNSSTGGTAVGRVTTAGTVTIFKNPFIGPLQGITSGPDGALWFGALASMGRLTTSGPGLGNRFLGPNSPALLDIDASGGPGPGDLSAVPTLSGNQASLVGPWETTCFDPDPPSNVLTLSNPQAGTGIFQTISRGAEQGTVGGFIAGNRPTQVSILDDSRSGTGTLLDSNADGAFDSVQGSEPGGSLNFTSSLVYADITGDGKSDYVSVPWGPLVPMFLLFRMPFTTGEPGSLPQVWLPLADTNADGTPDSVAFDLDGDGNPDPQFFMGPALAGPPIVPSGLAFFTLDPCRVFDTRNPDGPLGGPALSSGVLRNFTVTGQCGIPAGVQAISGNITVTQPGGQGHLTLFPTGGSQPVVSSMNFGAGQTRANNVIVSLDLNGRFTVSPFLLSGTTHLILDVNGYFAPGGSSAIAGPVSSSRTPSGTAPSGRAPLSAAVLAATLGLCPVSWLALKRRRRS